jgi:hypothetical protein
LVRGSVGQHQSESCFTPTSAAFAHKGSPSLDDRPHSTLPLSGHQEPPSTIRDTLCNTAGTNKFRLLPPFALSIAANWSPVVIWSCVSLFSKRALPWDSTANPESILFVPPHPHTLRRPIPAANPLAGFTTRDHTVPLYGLLPIVHHVSHCTAAFLGISRRRSEIEQTEISNFPPHIAKLWHPRHSAPGRYCRIPHLPEQHQARSRPAYQISPKTSLRFVRIANHPHNSVELGISVRRAGLSSNTPGQRWRGHRESRASCRQ